MSLHGDVMLPPIASPTTSRSRTHSASSSLKQPGKSPASHHNAAATLAHGEPSYARHQVVANHLRNRAPFYMGARSQSSKLKQHLYSDNVS
jgi:hypothetical protein